MFARISVFVLLFIVCTQFSTPAVAEDSFFAPVEFVEGVPGGGPLTDPFFYAKMNRVAGVSFAVLYAGGDHTIPHHELVVQGTVETVVVALSSMLLVNHTQPSYRVSFLPESSNSQENNNSQGLSLADQLGISEISNHTVDSLI